MQNDYRRKLLKTIANFLLLILALALVLGIAWIRHKLTWWMIVILGFGFVVSIAGILQQLTLLQVGQKPEAYQKYLGLPIARLKEKLAFAGGGRPYGRLKNGRWISDPDVLAFLVEARRRFEREGGSYAQLVSYCQQFHEDPSTVRDQIKKYKAEIDNAEAEIDNAEK